MKAVLPGKNPSGRGALLGQDDNGDRDGQAKIVAENRDSGNCQRLRRYAESQQSGKNRRRDQQAANNPGKKPPVNPEQGSNCAGQQ